jgi:hypothetical protein
MAQEHAGSFGNNARQLKDLGRHYGRLRHPVPRPIRYLWRRQCQKRAQNSQTRRRIVEVGLDAGAWLRILGIAASIFVIVEIEKAIVRRLGLQVA